MKKKLIITLIILLSFGCQNISNNNNNANITTNNIPKTTSSSKITYADDYIIQDIKKVEICSKLEGCHAMPEAYYLAISYDTNDENINDIIAKINNTTNNYYQKTLQSKIQKDEMCNGVIDIYNYGYYAYVEIIRYINERYIILGTKTTEYNSCKLETISNQSDITIYDKNSKKIITQDEYRQYYGITDEIILKSIQKYESDNNVTIDSNNIVVYFNENYGLVADVKVIEENKYVLVELDLSL